MALNKNEKFPTVA